MRSRRATSHRRSTACSAPRRCASQPDAGSTSSSSSRPATRRKPTETHSRSLRGEVREALLTAMNDRLQSLTDSGASLGIAVERIDMTAFLPPDAKTAFDAVLLASQAADRGVAMARTDGERRRQEAARERERLLSAAQASAKELISKANVDTLRISALEQEA